MGNGSICKVGRRARPGPARVPAGPGPCALPGPACPSRARPARFAGPGLPLPGRSAQISRSRSVAGPARRKRAWQTVLPGPVCGTSAGPLTHSRARAGGFAGPVLREAGRRGENRPGKSTLGGPGAATFDPAGARRCPCRARNRPRPGPPHLRPGPQLYPARLPSLRCFENKREAVRGTSLSLEVLEVDILWPRWVARIRVTRSTEACFLTADRQCTELPLLRLPRLVPEFRGSGPMRQTRDLARVVWRGLAARKGCVRSRSP